MLFKRFAVFVISLLLLANCVTANDWILGAMEFTYTQDVPRSSRDLGIASSIPCLVLEKVSSNATHIPSRSELLQRSMYELKTERLSLFLQLSREVKVRDSLIFTEPDLKKRQKKFSQQEEKIKELETQIDKNLTDAKEKNLLWESQSEEVLAQFLSEPKAEKIKLYKNDSSVLYEPTTKISHLTMDSPLFSDVAVKDGVNGILTGNIVSYGDYALVTVELRTYPGGELIGTVSEVGSLGDYMEIARNLSYALMPIVVNARPVRLFFEVLPVEAKNNAQIIVDGVICNHEDYIVDIAAGKHIVEVMCDGYFSKTIEFDFSESSNFLLKIPLEKKRNGTFDITIQNDSVGSVFANGQMIGKLNEANKTSSVQINGKTILGQLRVQSPDGKPLDSYYYVPKDIQSEGSSYTVALSPQDSASKIEERRIWMYRGYSALLLSLPLSFFAYGKYNAAYNGYTSGAVSADVINNWALMQNATAGISILAGGFFIFELVRYLRSVDSLLPKKASVVPQDSITQEPFVVTEGQ